MKIPILFLYTEIAGYVVACLNALSKQPGVEVYLVRYPVNKEAPFQFQLNPEIQVYERKELDRQGLIDLVTRLNPAIIVCSGWIDKDYLAACRKTAAETLKVLTLDNQWRGTWKQYLATMLSPFTLKRTFTHAWVPGSLQRKYAQKLGFDNDKILEGFYSADYDFFHNIYLQNRERRQRKFPKRLIYTGRYYAFKGILDLWNAFIELQEEQPNEWELWCMGTGDIEPVQHPRIKHFGFIQPTEMASYISEGGVFILPSLFEPWGVVVHEFAASGFPIVCSDAVGARLAFVEHGYNGYIYRAKNKNELKEHLKKIMTLPSNELMAMGNRSIEKAAKITPDIWAVTLLSIHSQGLKK